MGLDQIARELVREEGADLLARGSAIGELARFYQSETSTQSLVAAAFWDAYTRTERYKTSLRYAAGRGPWRWEPREIVVCHGTPRNWRFDLAVVLPPWAELDSLGPRVEAADLEGVSIQKQWYEFARQWRGEERWLPDPAPDSLGHAPDATLVDDLMGRAVAEMGELLRPKFFYVRGATGVPQSRVGNAPIGVEDPSTGESSLVGVLAMRDDGSRVMTAANHAVAGDLVRVAGGDVDVVAGSKHEITDSCLLERPGALLPTRSVVGPKLQYPGPREPAGFLDSSGRTKQTVVKAFDRKLFHKHATLQRCIYTTAVTSGGDSGTALVNGQDEVLGFCWGRAGIEDPDPDSVWFWADAVYDAQRLTKRSHP